MSAYEKYRKKLLNNGDSKYVIIPKNWKHHEIESVDVEMFDDKIIITPAEK